MVEINICDDFTDTPGARTYDDGEFSGQEFYDKILLPKYEEALKKKVKLQIDLDGTYGYASSFLNEAFSRLGNKYKPNEVWDNLILISNEVPKYIDKIKEYIYEKRK
ncbi:STAS-like domain-containing protein [Formosa maritima]|uniref:DUF4325 domain-containing protein n=1 Tax=Formosa maritima TaxID=2592046 RepID=A0A5D0GII5_9FLAO|nr:STAS-like domain-containing protein [Formosa maritima]TYA57362.1 DUF4325 domain-containing protein [Formosa maritima]